MGGISEIRNVKENQLWLVSNNKVILNEGKVVHIVVNGPQNHEIATAHFKLHQQIASMPGGKVSYLVILDEAGKFFPEARKIWNEIGNRADTRKIAFLGSHPVAKVLADFLMIGAEKPKLQYFDDKQSALEWLAY